MGKYEGEARTKPNLDRQQHSAGFDCVGADPPPLNTEKMSPPESSSATSATYIRMRRTSGCKPRGRSMSGRPSSDVNAEGGGALMFTLNDCGPPVAPIVEVNGTLCVRFGGAASSHRSPPPLTLPPHSPLRISTP